MERLLELPFAFAAALVLAATIRVSFRGLGNMPPNRWAKFMFHDAWAYIGIAAAITVGGAFGRGEVSHWPLTEFRLQYEIHGLVDGLVSAAGVVVAELWLLWVPAHSYIRNHVENDDRFAWTLRALNIAVGLLLTTHGNIVQDAFGHYPSLGEAGCPAGTRAELRSQRVPGGDLETDVDCVDLAPRAQPR